MEQLVLLDLIQQHGEDYESSLDVIYMPIIAAVTRYLKFRLEHYKYGMKVEHSVCYMHYPMVS